MYAPFRFWRSCVGVWDSIGKGKDEGGARDGRHIMTSADKYAGVCREGVLCTVAPRILRTATRRMIMKSKNRKENMLYSYKVAGQRKMKSADQVIPMPYSSRFVHIRFLALSSSHLRSQPPTACLHTIHTRKVDCVASPVVLCLNAPFSRIFYPRRGVLASLSKSSFLSSSAANRVINLRLPRRAFFPLSTETLLDPAKRDNL
jgi:hypothetical protein